jgi:hypothetical protein
LVVDCELCEKGIENWKISWLFYTSSQLLLGPAGAFDGVVAEPDVLPKIFLVECLVATT